MKIAIMQPYIFPYIGYFHLAYATDVFVFYDDVNYINRGWINRNRILLNGKDMLFSVPCKDASQNKLIKDIEVHDDGKQMAKLLSTIQNAYRKAPFYKEVFPVIEDVLTVASPVSIAEMAIKSVVSTCNYLGVERNFKTSSQLYTNQELKKGDRLIDICHIEGITDYVNAAGGKEIYTKEYFKEKGVNLEFISSVKKEYKQFNNTFVPWLSVIDLLMFCSPQEIREIHLPAYELE